MGNARGGKVLGVGDEFAVRGRVVWAGRHALRKEAVIRLVRARQIRPDSTVGPVYFVLYDVDSESRARELAAALYGDLAPLASAVPPLP